MNIVRYGVPTKLDEAPYGSRCMVKYHNQETYELYIQASKESEQPQWDFIGQFSHLSSQDHIDQMVSKRLGL